MSTNADLSILAASSVSAYIDACGTLVTPTLDGILATEGANRWSGYTWSAVRAALKAAWTARA